MPAAALPATRTEIPAWRTALEEQARTLGFASIGVAAVPDSGISARRLHEWLADGAHGGMEWMASRADERGDMRVLWPAARSLIVLGLSYAPAADPLALAEAGSHGRISVYAQGADYHDVAKRALKALARWLVDAAPALGLTTTDAPAPGVKVFVDTAPVMEKPLGQLAGLGWQGKHTNLVSRREGSWLFLGVIATTLALVPDAPHADRCGSCDACQRACPTDAFPAPYRLDARRCISYLTIEHKGPVPAELRKAIGNRVYGCDDCLAVCPWNRFAKAASGHHAFLPRAELAAPDLASLLDLDDAAFRRVFAGSPIKRIGRERMVRNAAIAAGNSGDRRLAERLAGLVADPSPLVRGAAIWALAMLDLPRALVMAERHAAAEDDDDVRAEWEAIRSPRAS